mgnify:CR=1 FL=1
MEQRLHRLEGVNAQASHRPEIAPPPAHSPDLTAIEERLARLEASSVTAADQRE